MIERINHFPPPAEDTLEDRREKADRPLVSPDLIEHLERKGFGDKVGGYSSEVPPHEIAAMVHYKHGQRTVVEYLRNLLEEQGKR